MKLNKLKEFLSVADALSNEIKDMRVDMMSVVEPTVENCGCHAGLVSIIAKDLPELEHNYYNHYCYESFEYKYLIWSDSLAVFLGFNCADHLQLWAKKNPDLWGNKNGYIMFSSLLAINASRKRINHRDIINHWHKVALNIENVGKKMKKNIIYNGDCVEIINTKVDNNSIDLVFADPPYNLSGKALEWKQKGFSKVNEYWDIMSSHEYIDFTIRWICSCHRSMKEN